MNKKVPGISINSIKYIWMPINSFLWPCISLHSLTLSRLYYFQIKHWHSVFSLQKVKDNWMHELILNNHWKGIWLTRENSLYSDRFCQLESLQSMQWRIKEIYLKPSGYKERFWSKAKAYQMQNLPDRKKIFYRGKSRESVFSQKLPFSQESMKINIPF